MFSDELLKPLASVFMIVKPRPSPWVKVVTPPGSVGKWKVLAEGWA